MKKVTLFTLLSICFYSSNLFSQQVLSLEEAKNLALKNNINNKNSILDIEASEQITKSAFTNYFPSISAGGLMFKAQEGLMEMENQGGNLPVYDGNPANLQNPTQFAYMPATTVSLLKNGTLGFINIIQPLYAGGRINNGNNLSELGKEVSILKGKLSNDEILLSTEEQFWQIITLEEKRKTINKYEELLKRLLTQVDDAQKSGLVLRNDVLKVKLKLSELLFNKSKLDNGKNLALMAFSQYIGIKYDSSLILRENINNIIPPDSFFIDNNIALTNRTEYSLLKKSVDAEKLQTKMKLGEYLPQAGIGINGTFMKFDENNGRTIGMIFGTVSIPISNWWSGSYELQNRKIKEEIAENNLKNNSELLLLQIEKVRQDLVNSYKQVRLSEESKAQAEENLKVSEDSYKNGLITVSDLLEAQASLQNIQDQLFEAKANYLIKVAIYLKVTGR